MTALYRRLHFYAGNVYRASTIPWYQRKVHIEQMCTIFGCSFGDDGWHHLRRTLEEYDANPDIDYRSTSAYFYLKNFRPTSISQLAAVDADEEFLPLFVYPWGSFRQGESFINKDPLTSRFCGPSEDEFIEQEFKRFIGLYKQLRLTGYRPWHYGNTFIGGTFLIKSDGRLRFIVLQGNHRTAILAHLGYRTIIVRNVSNYLVSVHEDNLPSLPLVQQGRLSLEHARKIFDYFFDNNGRHVRAMLINDANDRPTRDYDGPEI